MNRRENTATGEKKQMDLSLERLIEKPDCGFRCVGEDYEFSCGCGSCAKTELWADGELDIRTQLPKEHSAYISEEGLWFINDNFDSEKGYLRGKGCILPRNCRPEECLRTICNRLTALENN